MVSIELVKALVRAADNPDIFFISCKARNSAHYFGDVPKGARTD